MADATITIIIPEAKIPQALQYFLAERAMPQVVDPEDDTKTVDKYAPLEWVTKCGRDYYTAICKNGKKTVEATEADTGLFI